MLLGKVVGQVVPTVRDPGLRNLKLLLVDVVDPQGQVVRPGQVAADILGAGEGEMVLLAMGSSARLILADTAPIDLAVVGIVDQVTSAGRTFYNK